jgi:L-rhamnose-H+ transport protein
VFWILVTAFAGVCTGSFGLPMKLNKRWMWENTWGVYAIWVLLIVPWAIAFLTVPNLFQSYCRVGAKVLFLILLFGSCWGVGQIAFGKGLDYLGIGMGFSLQIGLIIVVGSLLPLFLQNPDAILKKNGLAVIAGVLIIVTSLVISGFAATMKEKDLAVSRENSHERGQKSTVRKGLICCVIAGLFCPGLNYAYVYGGPLTKTAMTLGAHRAVAANAVLPLCLFGPFFINLGYAMWLLNKNKTWALYQQKDNRVYYLYTLIMGVWTVGVALFGVAAANMGDLGSSIGWAIINSASIFWANILGILTGEWKGTAGKTLTTMIVGLAVLLAGICTVGWANTL